jgi:hypothetical protein
MACTGKTRALTIVWMDADAAVQKASFLLSHFHNIVLFFNIRRKNYHSSNIGVARPTKHRFTITVELT